MGGASQLTVLEGGLGEALRERERIAIRASPEEQRKQRAGPRGLERRLARFEDLPLAPPQCPRTLSQPLVSLEGRGELRDLPALRRVDDNAGVLRVFRVQTIEVVSAQHRPGPVAATF